MGLAAAAANLDWGECVVPAVPVPPALRAEVRRAVGAVPGWLPRLAPSPWIVRALCEIIERPFAHAPLDVCNLVALAVSQENSCRYCYGVQRAVFKILGYRDQDIDAIARDAQVGELTPAARAALDLARRLTRANPRPGGADFEALVRAGFSRPAAAEIGGRPSRRRAPTTGRARRWSRRSTARPPPACCAGRSTVPGPPTSCPGGRRRSCWR